MKVGFLGLGEMGRGMVRNLLKAGHDVWVWNRSPEPAQALAEAGATPVPSPLDVAESDAFVTMLADDAAVRSVVLESGLLAAIRNDLVHVGCSTVSVALAQELTASHTARGVGYVSAPVFGRPEAAAAGALNIIAAGAADAIGKVQPLLDAMGQKTWPAGDEPFRANLIKIAGNMMIAAAIEAMAEATSLGEANGIPPETMLDIYTGALFPSPVYKRYGAAIASKRHEPAGFKLKLGLKDIRLALEAGDASNVPLPFGSVLRDAMLSAMAAGRGDQDWSALAEIAWERAGLRSG